jgi:hypothetical protein
LILQLQALENIKISIEVDCKMKKRPNSAIRAIKGKKMDRECSATVGRSFHSSPLIDKVSKTYEELRCMLRFVGLWVHPTGTIFAGGTHMH